MSLTTKESGCNQMTLINDFLKKRYEWKYDYKTSYTTENKKDIHVHFTSKTDMKPFITFVNKLGCKIINVWDYPFHGISIKVRTQ